MKTALLCLLVSVLTAIAPASGKVARIRFDELVATADFVGIVRVTSVTRGSLFDKRVANAVVLDVWKGEKLKKLVFLADPTWSCDISTASRGEHLLVFLSRGVEFPFEICHAGRGRMPLRSIDGESYATFFDDIDFPQGTIMVKGPEPLWDFIRSIKLSTVRDLVARYRDLKPKEEKN